MFRKDNNPDATPPSEWTKRYGHTHRFTRVHDFPEGIDPPRRVRIYRRRRHYYNLQWWDPFAKRTLNHRVDGDLLQAIMRSRQIEQELEEKSSLGQSGQSITYKELISRFLTDLQLRVDADEISTRTHARYTSALAHYLCFLEDQGLLIQAVKTDQINRDHARAFTQYLSSRVVSPNGHPNTKPKPLHRPDMVLDVVRAVYQWACDPRRGGLLPSNLINPFLRTEMKRRRVAKDPLMEPDVTLKMAADMLKACDTYAAGVLGGLVLYGLRASEPIYIFHEYIGSGWVTLPCIPELNYQTKGLRDKKLPRLDVLSRLWHCETKRQGLVLRRRSVVEGKERPPLLGCSLDELITEHAKRVQQLPQRSPAELLRCRDAVIADAGGMNYGHIDRVFRRIAGQLVWPKSATLKGLRHLFNTSLANGGMLEHERRYLMGHAPGRDAITVYTHMNRLSEHYHAAINAEMGELLTLLEEHARTQL